MLQKLTKGIMFLATMVAVPYTVALLSNILYGWPARKNKFKRALSPRKVLALNYTCLQLVYRNFKYAPLWLRWTKFYRSLDPKFVRKNLAYGSHEQTMDLYLPQGVDLSQPRPVVVFIYGGAWSNGNKKMYGLLCSEIANKLRSLVCCPNYSLYPQGYVDDMVQDVVDCVSWIHQNVADYGGDKSVDSVNGKDRGVLRDSRQLDSELMGVVKDDLTDQSVLKDQKEVDSIEESLIVVKAGEGDEVVDDTIEEINSDDSSVETVLPNDAEKSQSLAELGEKIKAVIGLAGVYDISDHFQHEMSRGIEDVSRMTRAMYGEDHFDRFSPSILCQNIVNGSCLPKFVLVHGTEDHVVPLTSTTKLAEVLTDKFADITVRILPGCDHYEVCLDLMEPNRKCYGSVMGIIMETATKALKKIIINI
ncbi:hypothetical protein FSP39_025410 [Pinctada imbricata]|uniref:Uncharacterized protein n=1 Tax=Pinctada imbricata TaxID=66713 RepID=A0AA88XUQ3_PINIB|nr:hypothetical protein FSP39_025410 [Pinctada imbricata]